MISITLEINRMCNLQCTYCYMGEKDQERMTFETAKNSVEFAIRKIVNEHHKNRKIDVDFLGGEPLLSFSMIKEIVSYCEQRKIEEQISFNYTITTNGTVFSDEIYDFLVKYRFSIKVSLDGDEYVNDLNRKDCNGAGSFKLVERNLHYFRRYEKETDKLVIVSNVLSKNTYRFYDKTVKYLVEELGFRYIDTGFNSYETWSVDEMEMIKSIYEKVLLYYFDCAKKETGFMWGIMEDSLSKFDNIYRTYSCGAGTISFYISFSGNYFLCPSLMGEQYCLGNVNNPHYTTLFQKFISEKSGMKKVESKKCHICKYEPFCTVKGCFASSIVKNETILNPSQESCKRRRILYDMIRSNYYELQQVRASLPFLIQ